MAKQKLTEQETMKVTSDRQMQIYKSDRMIQKGRHKLSLQEQRCVLFAMSKIKPNDTISQEYTFDIKDFYRATGLEKDTYTELKSILKTLSDKSWWVELEDGSESLVRWFTTLRTNKGTGKVTIKFHEDMMPFLIDVTSSPDSFYTKYSLQYVLPMTSRFSPKLYELLKSYQKNNQEWFFDIEELKKKLDCEHYKNFNDFKRFALAPAVEEINKYTDIKIAWDVERKGRKVTRVIFYMLNKKAAELTAAKVAGREALDGQIDLEEMVENIVTGESIKRKFFRENE